MSFPFLSRKSGSSASRRKTRQGSLIGQPPHRYNRYVFQARLCTLAMVVLLAGCSKNIQSNEAVKKGVLDHLSQNKSLQMSSMDVDVTSVTFRGDEADAMVSFKPKGMDASSGMQMRYTLERKGNAWVVRKSGASGGGMGHGAMAPPADGSSAMPPNHPPVGSAPAPGKQQ